MRLRPSLAFSVGAASVAAVLACATAHSAPPSREVAAQTEASAPAIRIAQAVEPEPAGSPPPSTPGTVQEAAVATFTDEERQLIGLLADLQRFANAPSEELRRELTATTAALNRGRTDANRIRLAILLTLPAAGPTDDGRALTLLDSVTGRPGGASPLKQLAVVLYAQISERQRGMSEERKKSAAAQEKLDQLRAVERSLLLERNRNAGGAGGGGGGGGTGR